MAQSADDRPPGCWWQPSNGLLFFNVPPVGAPRAPCGDAAWCVCCCESAAAWATTTSSTRPPSGLEGRDQDLVQLELEEADAAQALLIQVAAAALSLAAVCACLLWAYLRLPRQARPAGRPAPGEVGTCDPTGRYAPDVLGLQEPAPPLQAPSESPSKASEASGDPGDAAAAGPMGGGRPPPGGSDGEAVGRPPRASRAAGPEGEAAEAPGEGAESSRAARHTQRDDADGPADGPAAAPRPGQEEAPGAASPGVPGAHRPRTKPAGGGPLAPGSAPPARRAPSEPTLPVGAGPKGPGSRSPANSSGDRPWSPGDAGAPPYRPSAALPQGLGRRAEAEAEAAGPLGSVTPHLGLEPRGSEPGPRPVAPNAGAGDRRDVRAIQRHLLMQDVPHDEPPPGAGPPGADNVVRL